MTLLDAINHAGGLKEGNTAYSVYLTRNHQTQKIALSEYLRVGRFSQNFVLQNGDVVHVPGNNGEKVFVLGQVDRQSVLRIDSYGLSLTEALTQTGGVGGLTADATGIFVIRARNKFQQEGLNFNKNKSKVFSDVYQLDLSNALSLVVGTQFKLQPMDVVFVTSTPSAYWVHLLNQLLDPLNRASGISDSVGTVKTWFNG